MFLSPMLSVEREKEKQDTGTANKESPSTEI